MSMTFIGLAGAESRRGLNLRYCSILKCTSSLSSHCKLSNGYRNFLVSMLRDALDLHSPVNLAAFYNLRNLLSSMFYKALEHSLKRFFKFFILINQDSRWRLRALLSLSPTALIAIHKRNRHGENLQMVWKSLFEWWIVFLLLARCRRAIRKISKKSDANRGEGKSCPKQIKSWLNWDAFNLKSKSDSFRLLSDFPFHEILS